MKKSRTYKVTKKEEELAKYMDEYLQKAEAEAKERLKNMTEQEMKEFNKKVISFGLKWQL